MTGITPERRWPRYWLSLLGEIMKRRITCGNCEWDIIITEKLLTLFQRYHGGWLAPNIYFLGHAGCVQVNGIRIAGASGIFNAPHFPLGASYICFLQRLYRPINRQLRKSPVRSFRRSKYLPYAWIRDPQIIFGKSCSINYRLSSVSRLSCTLVIIATHISLARLAPVNRTTWRSPGSPSE